MDENKESRIADLLQQGLELYGTGDVGRAFVLWNEVLELDPGNEEALDYIRDADRRTKPRSGSDGTHSSLVDDARRLLHAEDEEGALELLSNAPSGATLEVEAMVELMRARLFHRYRTSLGDLEQVPKLAEGAAGDLTSRNLPPSAGFLLSMVDGMTPLSDLVSVSGMDRFDALRSVHQMVSAGILEWNG